jgi:hypothetical protein
MVLFTIDYIQNDGILNAGQSKPPKLDPETEPLLVSEEEEQEEEQLTARVLGEGVIIPAPVTKVHHHHNHSLGSELNCRCFENDENFTHVFSRSRSPRRSVSPTRKESFPRASPSH